jgi:hypothetical protein
MESRIAAESRPDVVMIDSAPRPTAAPVRVSFGQLLSAGAAGLVQGAEMATSRLPGAPLAAAAVRAVGGTAPASSNAGLFSASSPLATSPEGTAFSVLAQPLSGQTPGVTSGSAVAGTASASGSSSDSNASIDASLQQSEQLNLYYLQVQQEVDAQNRSFTALSNVLKTEHDSAKAAIDNIHS